MLDEREPVIVPGIEETVRKGNIHESYRLLAGIPDGTVLKVGDLLVEIVPAIDEEKEMMRKSIAERKELALIKTDEETTVIEGDFGSIELDRIAGILYETVKPNIPAQFSHTHWDTNKHPFPAFSEIGFGDIPIFELFMNQRPQLECRIVFNSGTDVRSMIYRGKAQSL